MKVLLLSSEFPPGPGGIGTHAFHLARQLHRRTWQVEVLTAQDYVTPEEAEAFRRAQSFPVVRWGSGGGFVRNSLGRWKALRSALRRDPPQVVVASGQRSTWMAALGLPRGIPWIAIGHATEFGQRRSWQGRLTRFAFRSADAVVYVSRFTERLAATSGIRARRTYVVPNGADADAFRPLDPGAVQSIREEFGVRDARVVLTVGNVTGRKGQEVVIRALPRVVAALPNVVYVMVGLPTLKEPLERLATELGVARNVRFAGAVSPKDLVRWLNACDLFVMTSRTTAAGDCEGFGIAVVEAALCGKPAVVSGSSGLVEAIEPGGSGLVVPENDSGETAAAILHMLTLEAKRQDFGRFARERALREQTWEVRGGEYDEILRSVACPRSKQAPGDSVGLARTRGPAGAPRTAAR